MISVTGNALWHLVNQSDGVSKGVLLLLFFMSFFCWSLCIVKIISIRKHTQQLLDCLQQTSVHLSLTQLGEKWKSTEYSFLVFDFVSQVSEFLQMIFKKRDMHSSFTIHEMEMVIMQVQQMSDTIIEKERSGLALLSTSAGVAPLLGLFGTVWGLVHSFIRISEQQSADIATVAPGIAEALITTLAGLIVAIPALVMFNYLNAQLRSVEYLLQQLVDRVSIIVQCSILMRKADAQITETTPASSANDDRSFTHPAC